MCTRIRLTRDEYRKYLVRLLQSHGFNMLASTAERVINVLVESAYREYKTITPELMAGWMYEHSTVTEPVSIQEYLAGKINEYLL